jgi:hypothetical protein
MVFTLNGVKLDGNTLSSRDARLIHIAKKMDDRDERRAERYLEMMKPSVNADLERLYQDSVDSDHEDTGKEWRDIQDECMRRPNL